MINTVSDNIVNVRYMVDDVAAAVEFYTNHLGFTVNTEALPDIAGRFRIQSIPTMAVFTHGKEAARSTGARPAADIEDFVNSVIKLAS